MMHKTSFSWFGGKLVHPFGRWINRSPGLAFMAHMLLPLALTVALVIGALAVAGLYSALKTLHPTGQYHWAVVTGASEPVFAADYLPAMLQLSARWPARLSDGQQHVFIGQLPSQSTTDEGILRDVWEELEMMQLDFLAPVPVAYLTEEERFCVEAYARWFSSNAEAFHPAPISHCETMESGHRP